MPYLFKKGELVVPGELLAEGAYRAGENTYREKDRIYASQVGLANYVGKNVFIVAIKKCYLPKSGDLVVGTVVNLRLSGWIIDINAPYNAMLFTSDAFDRSFNARKEEMTDFLDLGDMILAEVASFDRTRDPILTIRESGLGKITQGRIVMMTPTKIPRLIGRKGSMVNMLKRETGCQITIGRNGLILVRGKDSQLEEIAILAIHTIEANAHTSGLTDKISNLLKEEGMKFEAKKSEIDK